MAKLKVDGLEMVVSDMIRMGQMVGPVADEMLIAGAGQMKTDWQDSITLFGHEDTGTMRKSVKPTKIKALGNSEKQIYVYPQGVDKNNQKKPRRNAEKAFVLHYGRSNMNGSHFVAKAETDGEPKARAAMEARWDQFLENGS